MKKRFFSIIMAVLVLMSAISVHVFAYSRFNEEIFFNKTVTGSWYTSVSTYGTFSDYETGYPTGGFYGFTLASPDRDGNGNSLKISRTQQYNNTKIPGVRYTPVQTLAGVLYLETSMYVPKTTNVLYSPRGITMRTASGTVHTLVQFTEAGGRFYLWDGATSQLTPAADPKWAPDTWYDIKIWYDLVNNDIKHYIVDEDGNVIVNKTYNGAENESISSGVESFGFINAWNFKKLYDEINTKKNDYSPTDVTCFDNIKIQTIDAMPGAAEKVYVADFENYSASTLQWAAPAKPANAEWSFKQNLTANVDGFMSEQTDKGTSLKFISGANTTTNPYLAMQYGTEITDSSNFKSAISCKVSVQVPDRNIARVIGIVTSKNTQINAALFYDDGTFRMFGNNLGTYKFNTWYDIEYSYDATNGAYFYKVMEGENEYIGSGTFEQAGGFPQTIWKAIVQLNNKSKTAERTITIDNLMVNAVASDFRLNSDISTNNKSILATERVYARFTKELNETAESLKSKVFEYYGNTEITSVSLIDKYTIEAVFTKEMGKSYRIDFKNILATDGSTTSDYIEFDVKKEDLYITAPVFKTADGEIPALLKPGKITASFDAYANNGKTFSFIYSLALFGGNQLKVIDSDVISIGSQKETYAREVTVPDDGNSYILKAFIWDAKTLAPVTGVYSLKAAPDGKPVAIVKLDDLRADNDAYLSAFTDFATWAEGNGIRISTGLIGESLETANATEERVNKVKALAGSKNVEVWFHGYANAATFKKDDNEEEQRNDFKKGIEAAAKYGIVFKTFAPPENNLRPITAELIEEEFTNFTTVMALSGSGQAYSAYLSRCKDLYNHIVVENGATGRTDAVDNLKTLWNGKSTSKYVLLQAHPASWAEYEVSEDRFKEFLLWLKDEGVVFMTPSEYTEYTKTLN